jgi:hypothetical protein
MATMNDTDDGSRDEAPEDDAERVARWKSNAALLLTYELRQRGRHAHRGL